jgi:hypothetical protein
VLSFSGARNVWSRGGTHQCGHSAECKVQSRLSMLATCTRNKKLQPESRSQNHEHCRYPAFSVNISARRLTTSAQPERCRAKSSPSPTRGRSTASTKPQSRGTGPTGKQSSAEQPQLRRTADATSQSHSSNSVSVADDTTHWTLMGSKQEPVSPDRRLRLGLLEWLRPMK